MKISVSKSEFKVLLGWALACAVLMFILTLFKINVYDVEKKEEEYKNATYSIVTDSTRYFTAMSGINKLYSYISSNDKDSIMEILDEDYVKAKNLTADSLESLNLFDFGSNISFYSYTMCEKKTDVGNVSYLVRGEEYLVENDKDDKYLNTKYYNIVLDNNNFTFKLKPVSEEEYKENCNE